MSWREKLSKQEPDPEKVVEHKEILGFQVPLNAYGKVPPSVYKKILDKHEKLKARLEEMKQGEN